MKETEKNMSLAAHNVMDSADILSIRLDTSPVLERVRIFLTGQVRSVISDQYGKPQINIEQLAEPKANRLGIHWLLNFCENIINPQVVQGNFDRDQFEAYIEEIHDGLLANVMSNLHIWGIREDDYEPICDTLMAIIQPFISRLIGNKERDSYGQSMKVQESSAINRGGKLINIGGG